jgi:hypothetical protein
VTGLVPDPLLLRKSEAPGMEPGTSGSVAGGPHERDEGLMFLQNVMIPKDPFVWSLYVFRTKSVKWKCNGEIPCDTESSVDKAGNWTHSRDTETNYV